MASNGRTTAGRPRIDIDRFRDQIQEAWDFGLSISDILDLINDELIQQDQVLALRTLKRRLSEWGLSRQTRTEVNEVLINRVRLYFFKYGYSDTSILRDLRREGFTISEKALRAIRWQNGMKRRVRTTKKETRF